MTQQLVFTSAPKGLAPGSRGFTTVACSRALSPQAVNRLESLSAYKPAFDIGHPQHKLNPIGVAYRLVKLAGIEKRVLSRSTAHGTDYSGRSNTFSHHLILEGVELSPAGPAWLCAQPGVFLTQWDQPPQYLEDLPGLPKAEPMPQACQTWAKVVGDAGWGGALVAAHFNAPQLPIYILYPPGTPMFALLAESLAILPPTRRWNVTFNTYFTTPHADVQCLWRCVLAGTDAERAIPKNATVLDLTRQLGRPPRGPAAQAAREGRIYEPAAQPPTSVPPLPTPVAPGDTPKPPPIHFDLAEEAGTGLTDMGEDQDLAQAMSPPPIPAPKPPPAPAAQPTPQRRATDAVGSSASRSLLWPIVAAAVGVVIVGALVITLALSALNSTAEPVQADPGTLANATPTPVVPRNPQDTDTPPDPVVQDPSQDIRNLGQPNDTPPDSPAVEPVEPATPEPGIDPETEPEPQVEPDTPDPEVTGLVLAGEPLVRWSSVSLDVYPQQSVYRLVPTQTQQIDLGVIDRLSWAFFLTGDDRVDFRVRDQGTHLQLIAPGLPRAERDLGSLRFIPDPWTGRVAADFTPGRPEAAPYLVGLRIGLVDQTGRLLLLAVTPPENVALGEPIIITPARPVVPAVQTRPHESARLVLRENTRITLGRDGRIRFGETSYLELGQRSRPGGRPDQAGSDTYILRAELGELRQLRQARAAREYNTLLDTFEQVVDGVLGVEVTDKFNLPVRRMPVRTEGLDSLRINRSP